MVGTFSHSDSRIPAAVANTAFASRREMMPLLSLIFSALFILFGTVIVQAFR